MDWPRLLTLTASLSCLPLLSCASAGYTPLLNGHDLSGWTATGDGEGWKIEGELLVCEGGSGWLMSDREYKDFVLKLEWKLPPAGNSGVALRAPMQGNPAYEGLEIQVLDHFHEQYKDIRDVQFTGSVYDLVPGKQEGLNPAGEWNRFEITHQGDHITVVLNGIAIVDTDLKEQLHRLGDHPGLGRSQGRIGLQAHDTRVEFRNIAIKEL